MNRTPQSTHHKKNPQTHRTARTQYSYFFKLFFVFILYALSWRTGWRQWSGPPPQRLSGTGRKLSNRLVSSAVIFYLNFTVWLEKEDEEREGV